MTRKYSGERPKLLTLLGSYPKTQPLWSKTLTSPALELDIADIPVAQNGFKRLVRECEFDVAEVAIVTYLQARAAGKPYRLLPFVMNGGFHHGSLWCHVDAGVEAPSDLNGKRIGMRSYPQTTPTWVRGFLSQDYGVRLATVDWVTFEEGHVAEMPDPAGVRRAPEGAKLPQMLLDGELDAVIMASGVPKDESLRTVFSDPKAEALAWHAKHHAVPINHMVSVHEDLLQQRPELVREIFRLLVESRCAGTPGAKPAPIELQPIGLERVRSALELVTCYVVDQKLVPVRFDVDQLFDPITGSLGS